MQECRHEKLREKMHEQVPQQRVKNTMKTRMKKPCKKAHAKYYEKMHEKVHEHVHKTQRGVVQKEPVKMCKNICMKINVRKDAQTTYGAHGGCAMAVPKSRGRHAKACA